MAKPSHIERLQGMRVLLAENQVVIAFDLEIMLGQLGCVLSKTTASIAETLAVLDDTHADIVILNPLLEEGSALPVAEALQQRRIPFILVKGHRAAQPAHPAWDQALHLEWPYGSSRLGDVLLLALAQSSPDNTVAAPSLAAT